MLERRKCWKTVREKGCEFDGGRHTDRQSESVRQIDRQLKHIDRQEADRQTDNQRERVTDK